MRKIKIFGKRISAILLALLLTGGLASAGLLAYYGRITTTATVEQSIVLTGGSCTNNECSSAFNVVGSETGYSDTFDIKSNTVNDLGIKFENTCAPNCDGVIITNEVELSVIGFEGTDDPFAEQYYKTTDYDWTGNLDDLNTIDYVFKITTNGFGSDTLAPYVVLVGDGIGDYDVAVYMIPDGKTYSTGTEYKGIISGDSKFHVPGDGECTQSSPCTLTRIQEKFNAPMSKIRYALGAWPGTHSQEFKAFIGLTKINGAQAIHKSLKVYGMTTIPTIEKYDFAELISPGTYTIRTKILPA